MKKKIKEIKPSMKFNVRLQNMNQFFPHQEEKEKRLSSKMLSNGYGLL